MSDLKHDPSLDTDDILNRRLVSEYADGNTDD